MAKTTNDTMKGCEMTSRLRHGWMNGALWCALLAAATGCNAGLGALVAGLTSGSSSGAAPSPSAISAFTVLDKKTSPALIRFVLTDANADAVELELLYELADATTHTLTALQGAANPATYASSKGGTTHEVAWDFAAELGFQPSGGLVDGVTVFGRILNTQGPPTAIVAGATGAVGIALGNDAPVVDAVSTPTSEFTGIVPIEVTISDSSGDPISLRIDYEIAGEGSWQRARPGGMASTPDYAIVGLNAPAAGVTVTFFWDAAVDLPMQEHSIRLRFTPTDATHEGLSVISNEFRIDNNSQASIFQDGLLSLGSGDFTGGIALPFNLRDLESDDVRVVFQWRRPGQDFLALPTDDPAAVFAIQDDPALRKQYQVCSERVSHVSGLPEPVDATHVRLPELGTSRVALATPDLIGRDLELLRPLNKVVNVTTAWTTSPFTALTCVIPVGDGLEALALDQGGAGWRVRRAELASGTLLPQPGGSLLLGPGPGTPTAMAIDATESTLFVATASNSVWTVNKIDARTGALLATVTGGYSGPVAPRGIAALSRSRAVLTVDDTLQEIRLGSTGSPAVIPIVSGLSTPLGVAVDPFDRHVVFVAEQAADRVVSVNLMTRSIRNEVPQGTELFAPGPPGGTQLVFPSPRAIAFDNGGRRLIVAAEVQPNSYQLRAIQRRSPHDLDGDGLANSFVYTITELPQAPATISIGRDNLVLLTGATTNSIIALGGIEQRRLITEAPTTTNIVTVDQPFEPLLDSLPGTQRHWRVRRSKSTYRGSPTGLDHVFPWDSADVLQGGPVLMRGLPFDSELGFQSNLTSERVVISEILGDQITVDDLSAIASPNDPTEFLSPTVLDFDLDGDLDIVIATSTAPRVVLQTAPGQFAPPAPIPLPLTDSLAVPLLLEDLDADGYLDLIHMRSDFTMELFHGTGPGTFVAVPDLITTPAGGDVGFRKATMTAGDVDQDGKLDLIVTAPTRTLSGLGFSVDAPPPPPPRGLPTNTILVFLQGDSGTFNDPPLRLGGEGVTNGARNVATGDIDGDGLVDLAAACDGDLNDLLLPRAGIVPPGPLKPPTEGAITVHFQDVSGEFLESGTVIIGELYSPPAEDVPTGRTTSAASTMQLEDLDEDGDLDLIVGHGRFEWLLVSSFEFAPLYNHVVTVFWQTSPRVFDPTPLVLEGPEGNLNRMSAVVTADVNGDGWLDVVAQGEKGIHTFFATAPGVFDLTPMTIPYLGPEPGSFGQREGAPTDNLGVIDIDADGDLDFVFRDISTNTIQVRFSGKRGFPSFPGTPTYITNPVTDGTNDVVTADFNGDGQLDIATSTGGFIGLYGTEQFQIYYQTAPRAFASSPLIMTGGTIGIGALAAGPVRVEAADMDQDGDLDLVGVTQKGNSVEIYYQESPGVFGLPQTFMGPPPNDHFGGNALVNLCISDYNRDGTLDILSAPAVDLETIGISLTSSGTLGQVFHFDITSAPLGPRPESIATVDFDGDGDLELLIAARGFPDPGNPTLPTDLLYVFDGITPTLMNPTPFDPTPSVLSGMGRRSILHDDVDGDGDVDLLTTGVFGESHRLMLHLRTATGSYETTIHDTIEVSQAAHFASSAVPPMVELRDLDHDGDLDIALLRSNSKNFPTSNLYAGELVFIEQLAPGVFASAPVLMVPYALTLASGAIPFPPDNQFLTVEAMRLGDIDGDGEIDAMIAQMTAAGPPDGTTIMWGE